MKKINLIFVIIFILVLNSNIYAQTASNTKIIEHFFNVADLEIVFEDTYKNYNDSVIFTGVQGFCSDGDFFYIALLSHGILKGDIAYTDQMCKLIKIDMKSKKTIKQRFIGRVGHANSLTYNNKLNKIYIAPCTKAMPYVYAIDRDLIYIAKENIEDVKGNVKNKIRLVTLAYNAEKDSYVVKNNDTTVGILNSSLRVSKSLALDNNLKAEINCSQQAISAEKEFFYSVCSDIKNKPTINYILKYNYDGKCLARFVYKSGKERLEFEQLACINGEYYILANILGGGKFRVYKIKTFNK